MTTGIEEERNRIHKAQHIVEYLRSEFGSEHAAAERLRDSDHVFRRGVENNMGLKRRPSAATWLVVAALLEAECGALDREHAAVRKALSQATVRGKRVRRSA